MSDRCAGSLVEHFSSLTDPRMSGKVRHKLLDMIILTICAVICSADDWVAVAEYGRVKEKWLRRFLELPNGIPSHDTLGRVFALLSATEFERCFQSWIQAVFQRTHGQVVAVDGKRVRRSYDRWRGVEAIHLVSAWACANRMVLGQRKTDEKSNEITAIPELLRVLELSGCIVTIDAMGCQSAIAAQIVEQGADYLLAVKGNQRRLAAEVREFFEAPERKRDRTLRRRRTVEKDHGRIEERRYTIAPAPVWTGGAREWPKLASLVKLDATRTIGETTSSETRYYISSLPPDDPARVANAIRSHWSIENSLHWTLDVVFEEDQSRIRNGYAAENLALIRRLTLSLLKNERTTKTGIATKRLRAGWDDDYLLKVLAT